jgi:penicillin-binding protein 1A
MGAEGTDKLHQNGSAVGPRSDEVKPHPAVATERKRPVFAWVGANRLRLTYVALALFAGLIVWAAAVVLQGLPDDEAVRNLANGSRGTVLLDVDGRELGEIVRERRIEVPLAQVSPHVLQAVVAIEDQRFLQHGGVDVIRIGGAFLKNLRVGRVAEGGSTITQQLARQSFLTREQTFRRKVREALVAARIERQFTKDQILEFYLNKVYFGDGLYGIEPAALGYFGKHASELDVSEAALLAGLLKSPSTCAPTVDLDCAVERRSVVLQAMRDMGTIDAATAADAKASPVRLRDERPRERPFGEYFKAEVRRQLDEQFGHERVYQGDLIVHTTLDIALQQAAEAEVQAALRDIEARTGRRRGRRAAVPPDPLQAALVAIDVRSGEVRAMVGGRDFTQSGYNRATQARRQPGSAFKPFIYAAAVEHGFTPATRIENLRTPVHTVEGAWTPDDRGGSTDSMTMRTALRTSSNRAAVRMLQDVSIPAALRYIERFGFRSMPAVPSLALGSGEATLQSLTSAFATFGNAGVRVPPSLIRRVETIDGEVLYQHEPHPEPVVSEATAFIMTSILSDVVTAGTAAQAKSFGFTLPAAGKTGTTNDYHDAWFVGYTPSLATGVWIGYDRPRTIMQRGYAASLAVPLWARFMAVATRGDAPEPFPIPSSVRPVTICRISGALATDRCRNAVTVTADGFLEQYSAVGIEYFLVGTEPTEYCHAHDAPFYQEVLFDQDAPVDAQPLYLPGPFGTTGRDPDLSAPAVPMPSPPPMPTPPTSPPAPEPQPAVPIQPFPPVDDTVVPPPLAPPGG